MDELYGYCPKCGNHNLGVQMDDDNEIIYYCPCCDWESGRISD